MDITFEKTYASIGTVGGVGDPDRLPLKQTNNLIPELSSEPQIVFLNSMRTVSGQTD
jgi:hypothetical protein